MRNPVGPPDPPDRPIAEGCRARSGTKSCLENVVLLVLQSVLLESLAIDLNAITFMNYHN